MSIRPLPVHAHVCCLHPPGRALTQEQTLSRSGEGGGRALTRPARPLCQCGALISATACLHPGPVSEAASPYQLLAGPGFFNHSCPLSWLRRAAAPFPPAGNVAGNSEWSLPAPARRQSCGGGQGKQLGKRSGLPGDTGRSLPAPPRDQPGPRQGPRCPRALTGGTRTPPAVGPEPPPSTPARPAVQIAARHSPPPASQGASHGPSSPRAH